MTRRYESGATCSGEIQDLMIAMEAAMSVEDPPLTKFSVSGAKYKLTLERCPETEIIGAVE